MDKERHVEWGMAAWKMLERVRPSERPDVLAGLLRRNAG
jgi:hypothetical protein